MRETILHTVARHTADPASRRASLLALGGAVMAAMMARPSTTGAANAGKKARRRCKKQTRKRCQQDAAACRATLEAQCEGIPACLQAQSCCNHCSANGYVTCVLAIQ